MGTRRTAWHYLLTLLLRERAPRWIEVRDEVPLSSEPQRVDFLLLRQTDTPDPLDTGSTLRGLWPLLARDTVTEFKSPSRPYRTRDLHRLLGYGHQHFVAETARLASPDDLTLALIVPARTPSLDEDLMSLGLSAHDLGGGYAHAQAAFRVVLVEVERVAEQDRDDLVALFGRRRPLSPAATGWWHQHMPEKETAMDPTQLDDYDDVLASLIASLDPAMQHSVAEKLIEKLPLEQRLAGLAPEETLLALPDSVLRGLPASYVDSLPARIRDAVRARIGH